MRLINTTDLSFSEVVDSQTVKYAILSHRWEDGEVTYKEMTKDHTRVHHKRGYQKIAAFCELARDLGYEYVWIDTCCIDKKSSAELSEAINSMFQWYANADICCAYLYDVKPDRATSSADSWQDAWVETSEAALTIFSDSIWFARAWTLQELISPQGLRFYDSQWEVIGTRDELAPMISNFTGVPQEVLTGSKSFRSYPVAERMFWAGKRECERVEDIAYSLLGIFDVNLPLLYGEGTKAFVRLQEQIIRQSNDQSIFIWHADQVQIQKLGWLQHSTLLAPHPSCFSGDWCYRPHQYGVKPYSMTNSGLSINMYLQPWTPGIYLGIFQCEISEYTTGKLKLKAVGIFLKRLETHRDDGDNEDDNQYQRVVVDRKLWDSISDIGKSPFGQKRDIYIDVARIDHFDWETSQIHAIKIDDIYPISQYRTRAKFFNRNVKVYTLETFDHTKRIAKSFGGWHGTLAVISLHESLDTPVKTVVLGLDFEFRPICILSTLSLLPESEAGRSWERRIMESNYWCWSQATSQSEGVVDLDWTISGREFRQSPGRVNHRVWCVVTNTTNRFGIYFTEAELLSKDGQPSGVAYDGRLSDGSIATDAWVAKVIFDKRPLTITSKQSVFKFTLLLNLPEDKDEKSLPDTGGQGARRLIVENP